MHAEPAGRHCKALGQTSPLQAPRGAVVTEASPPYLAASRQACLALHTISTQCRELAAPHRHPSLALAFSRLIGGRRPFREERQKRGRRKRGWDVANVVAQSHRLPSKRTPGYQHTSRRASKRPVLNVNPNGTCLIQNALDLYICTVTDNSMQLIFTSVFELPGIPSLPGWLALG